MDLPAGLASIEAAAAASVGHFVYISVAQPAPIMRDYIEVRRQCEECLLSKGLKATILRPWYILGPGHWWPVPLKPPYRFMELLPFTRETAQCLGLVSLHDMLATLVWSIEHSPELGRPIGVPEIKRLGTAVL